MRIPASSVEEAGSSPGVLRPASPVVGGIISYVSFSLRPHIVFAHAVRAVYAVVCLHRCLFQNQYLELCLVFSCVSLIVCPLAFARAVLYYRPEVPRSLRHLCRWVLRGPLVCL